MWIGGLIGLLVVLIRRGRLTSPPGDGVRDDLGEDGAGTRCPATDGGAPVGGGGDPGYETPAPGGVALLEASRHDVALEAARGTATIVARFSTTAFVSVLALWAAGATLAWIELGSRQALTGTTYGRLILVKIGIVLVVAVAAAYNRFQLVPTILDEVDRAEARRARRGRRDRRGRRARRAGRAPGTRPSPWPAGPCTTCAPPWPSRRSPSSSSWA